MLELHRKIKLVKISIGLISTHIVMGIFQERIMKHPYVDSEGKSSQFSLPIAYVAIQCFVYTVAAVGTKLFHKKDKNETPQKYFAICSVFFVLAPVLSNMALKWVSYPAQVIGKAAKPIVVMILGVLIGHKSYRFQKYIFVTIIISGVIIFSFKPEHQELKTENLIFGHTLIGLSLLTDGALGALQDRMRSVSKPSSLNLMLYTNAWSSLYLITPLIVTREGIEFIYFCMTHSNVIIDLSIVVTVGTFGQFFISQMISNFGALSLSLVMTVRKFLTVFLSVIIFGHNLSILQWTATAMIFLALFGDAMFQGKSMKSNDNSQETVNTDNTQIGDVKSQKDLNLETVIIPISTIKIDDASGITFL